jgi:hypothetical protein
LLGGVRLVRAEAFRAIAREGIDPPRVFLNLATTEGIEQLATILERLDPDERREREWRGNLALGLVDGA